MAKIRGAEGSATRKGVGNEVQARLNLSRSAIGASAGRNRLRLGLDAKRMKYFSIGRARNRPFSYQKAGVLYR